MKFLPLFSGAVIAFCVFSVSAQAAQVSVSENITLGRVSAGETAPDLAKYITGANAEGQFNYSFSGKLEPNAKLSLTFAADKVGDIKVFGGGQLGDNPGLALGHLNDVPGRALGHSKGGDGALPFVALSNVGTAQAPVYNLVIENLSDKIRSFSAYFSALVDLKNGGSVTVGSSAAQVPLPAAAYLFGSGVLGLAAFAKRKKVKA